jgi:hypothetical protein
VSSPRRAGATPSNPRAGGAGRANSARLDGVAQVRPTRRRQAKKFFGWRVPRSLSRMRVRRSYKATVERVCQMASHLAENAHKIVPSLGRLISFAFRKKRQQADSCDVSLTSTPTTTISATVGGAFISPSKPRAWPQFAA